MNDNGLVWITISVLALSTVPAVAQSASELLEKGIYLEETAGQVEEAIKIYRRIVTDATAERASVAEALLRLGVCHLKKGDSGAATEAFERVLAEYPEQEQLVARVRAQLPNNEEEALELLPAPWEDGEAARMKLTLASGLPVRFLILTADTTELDGVELWRLRIRHQFFSDPTNQTLRQVLARRDTMVPVASVYRCPGGGHFDARYRDGAVTIETIGAGARREEKLDGPTFDREELYHLVRRLPLEVGSKETIRSISTMAGAAGPAEVEVKAKETVTVPAGELECYRVEIGGLLVLWYSTDPSRTLVKLEAAGLVAELEEVYVREPGRESLVSGRMDEQSGFSVTLPPDWLSYRRDDQGIEAIHLLDPNAETVAKIEIRRPRVDDGGCIFQAAAPLKLAQLRTALSGYELRKGSWSEREVAGWPAVSFAGNYRVANRELVNYWTFVESGDFCVDFTLDVAADRFEPLRTAFESIIESYQGPSPVNVELPESAAADAARAVLGDFHLAASSGDPPRFFEHLAPDAIFFGPGAADRFDTGALRERFSDVTGWMGEVTEPHVVVSGDGTLAWFDGRLRSSELGELRASGVLRKEGGRPAGGGQTEQRPAEGGQTERPAEGGQTEQWKIVQYHVAFPVPDPLIPDLAEMLRAHDEKVGRRPADPMPPGDESASGPAAGASSMLRDFHLARPESDGERFFDYFTPEAVVLLTDRSERLTMARLRAFLGLYQAQGHQSPTLTPVERHVHLSPEKNMAWLEERIEEQHLGQMRATGVLRRVDGTWKIAHFNLVILVPPELAEYLAGRIESFYAPG